MKKDFIQKLIFYVVIGVVGVIVDTVVLNVFYNLIFRPFVDTNNIDTTNVVSAAATLSAVMGGIAGFTNNFLLNEFLVYKQKGSKKIIFRRFTKYVITIVLGTFIIGKLIIFNIAYTGFGFGLTTSNLIAIAFGTFINYPINYFWTWGNFSVKEKLTKKS